MTHRHDLPPGLGPLTSLTHTHDGTTHTHVHSDEPAGPPQRLHLRGVVLPEGDERDLWLHDGVISFEPVADAITVATTGWILPGLVDAHCHVGLESHGAVSEERAEEHALTDREAGALLLRDAGSPLDTRFLQDREDLPKIIRAGRHIARPKRYSRNFAEEVEPDQLVDEVIVQAERGDGWVKIVGDWIDRDTGDLTPLWPMEVAKESRPGQSVQIGMRRRELTRGASRLWADNSSATSAGQVMRRESAYGGAAVSMLRVAGVGDSRNQGCWRAMRFNRYVVPFNGVSTAPP